MRPSHFPRGRFVMRQLSGYALLLAPGRLVPPDFLAQRSPAPTPSARPSGGTSVSQAKAGLNLLGGTTFKLKGSHLTPFAEARGEIGGGKTFVLTGGVRF